MSGKLTQFRYGHVGTEALDGVIQGIRRVDGGQNTPIATYTYGTSGLTNGAVVGVTDNLSGVSQSITYANAGGGVGAPSNVSETTAAGTTTTAYTYTEFGDRDTASYTTQAAFGTSAVVTWKYKDYVWVGAGTSIKRIFQTAVLLDPATGKSTPEEFQYVYSHDGKLLEADFGLTPQTTTPPPTDTVKSWYQTDLPQTRGRAHYEYDAGGRMMGVYYWWDTLSSGNYTSVPIRANTSQYELGTGLNRGLKTSSTYLTGASGSWQQQRTETYGYDPNLDYLTSADYGSGATTWQYDAAGNRSGVNGAGGWAYDNLNRMTASPGKTYSNDILGNRTGMTGNVVYTWDALNRMMSFTSGSNPSVNYTYRADGMRVGKKTTGGNLTQYRYDGQMGIEDLETTNTGGQVAQTRFALGARGIDAISKVTATTSSVSYPLYDCHGNMIAQLAKAGAGSFTVGNEQSFDAWGAPSAIGTQYPESATSAKYCANLGHKQDDESSLIYMRARYYEPASGRFISEDLDHDGINWFLYCAGNPVAYIDESGDTPESIQFWKLFAIAYAIAGFAAIIEGTMKEITRSVGGIIGLTNGFIFLVAWFGDAHVPDFGDRGDRVTKFAEFTGLTAALASLTAILLTIQAGLKISAGSLASNAAGLLAAYCFTIAMFLAFDDFVN